MLDLLKENLRGKNNHPHHYQTHDLLLRKVRVHEDGVTYPLLIQCFGLSVHLSEFVLLVLGDRIH